MSCCSLSCYCSFAHGRVRHVHRHRCRLVVYAPTDPSTRLLSRQSLHDWCERVASCPHRPRSEAYDVLEVHDSVAHGQRRLPRSVLDLLCGIWVVASSRSLEESEVVREVNVRMMEKPAICENKL